MKEINFHLLQFQTTGIKYLEPGIGHPGSQSEHSGGNERHLRSEQSSLFKNMRSNEEEPTAVQ